MVEGPKLRHFISKHLLKYTALLAFLLTGCSSFVDKMAVSTTAGLLYKATEQVETEKSWDYFELSTPANIKMMEGLLYVDPENLDLLVSLIKGHAAMAFVVTETLALEESYSSSSSAGQKYTQMTLDHYSRAIEFGLRYLKVKGLELENLQEQVSNKDGIMQLLEQKLSDDNQDIDAVVFTAQALGGLINWQKKNLVLVAQLPLVKGMFDWVCHKRPSINFGACGVFYGAYESGRPKMLGGNPELGQKLFLETIKQYPENALIRAAYVQYYLIPQNDSKGFKEQMSILEKMDRADKKALIWSPIKKESQIPPRMAVLRALGLKRYEVMKKFEKKLFN